MCDRKEEILVSRYLMLDIPSLPIGKWGRVRGTKAHQVRPLSGLPVCPYAGLVLVFLRALV